MGSQESSKALRGVSWHTGHPSVFGSAVGPTGWHKLSSGLVDHDQVRSKLAVS